MGSRYAEAPGRIDEFVARLLETQLVYLRLRCALDNARPVNMAALFAACDARDDAVVELTRFVTHIE